MAAMDSLSAWGPQPNSQLPPPIAQAPKPIGVRRRSEFPSERSCGPAVAGVVITPRWMGTRASRFHFVLLKFACVSGDEAVGSGSWLRDEELRHRRQERIRGKPHDRVISITSKPLDIRIGAHLRSDFNHFAPLE